MEFLGSHSGKSSTAGPLLAVALAIGLLIGIIQAATSINEMTLSFVPKLVVVMLTFGLMSSFILAQLSEYFQFILTKSPRLAEAMLDCHNRIDAVPGIDLHLVTGMLLQYFLASLRIGAFLLSAPIFLAGSLKVRIIIAFTLAAACGRCARFWNRPSNFVCRHLDDVVEITIGLTAGLTLTIWFAAMLLAGERSPLLLDLGYRTS